MQTSSSSFFIWPIIQQYAHLREHDSRRAGQQGPIRSLTGALETFNGKQSLGAYSTYSWPSLMCARNNVEKWLRHDWCSLPHATNNSCRRNFLYPTDTQLGHWVTGSMGHLGHLPRPGHRVIILTRCETRVFSGFRKKPKMQNVHLKCWNDKSHCQVSVVGLKSLDVSPCNELLLLPTSSHVSRHLEFIIEQGHRVNWIPGSLGRWVTKCDPVPSLVGLSNT